MQVAPCSTKLEWVQQYQPYEVFAYGADEIEWDPATEAFADKRDGFAALRFLHQVDPGYIGARIGVFTSEARERLQQAYRDYVNATSGTHGRTRQR